MKNLILSVFIVLGTLGAVSADSHTTTGIIEEVNSGGKMLVIHHQDFPGFMDEMTMPFQVENAALSAGLKVGDEVEFTIKRTDTGYPITEIKKIDSDS